MEVGTKNMNVQVVLSRHQFIVEIVFIIQRQWMLFSSVHVHCHVQFGSVHIITYSLVPENMCCTLRNLCTTCPRKTRQMAPDKCDKWNAYAKMTGQHLSTGYQHCKNWSIR
uniref:Uncharacterized protein n=1 Tax=Arundo donax TaxID=35708 RepID=A0A0A9FN88_ARUDO